jgi:hypothetical protein
MLKPKTESNKKYSRYQLPSIDDTYVLDASSGIYTPKSYQKAEKRKNIKWLEKWLPILISAIGIYLWIKTVSYANKQWTEMQKTSVASQQAAQTAACALKENISQFNKMFAQIQNQTTAQVTSATAAKTASGIAEDTLHISERAYITVGAPQPDVTKNVINLPVFNTGHIPTGEATASIYEVTLEVDEPRENIPFTAIVERHKDIMVVASIAVGSPITLTIPAPKVSTDRLNKGTQTIILAGTVNYNDGFPNTPMQTFPVCERTVFHSVSKQFYWVPCQETDIIKKLDTLDWKNNTNIFK